MVTPRVEKVVEAVCARALPPLLIFAAVALAATPWLRAYEVPAAPLYLLLAALVPVLVTTVAGERFGLPPVLTYGISAAGLAILVVAMGRGDLHVIWNGLSLDPTRLLTETLPLSGKAEMISAPVALTWICAAVTSELWTRSIRTAVCLLPPVALFVVAYAATAAAPGRDLTSGPALLGALALAAVVRHRRLDAERGVVDVSGQGGATSSNHAGLSSHGLSSDGLSSDGLSSDGLSGRGLSGRGSTLRVAAVGGAAAVALAAIVGAVAPTLPGMNHPAAPLSRTAPKLATVLIDPVDQIVSLRDSRPHAAATPLFTVTTNRPAPGYLSVATLDDYNGASWTFDTTFEPSGGRIPAAPEDTPGSVTDAKTATVTQQFRFDSSYRLALLPSLDRPIDVRDLTVDVDAETGMVLPAGRESPSGRVTTVSQTPTAVLNALPSADGIQTVAGLPDAVEAADTATPAGTQVGLAAAKQFLTKLTGQRPASTVAFLQAAARAMVSHEKRIDPALKTAKKGAPTAIGGTPLAAVINAVAVNNAATPEQFATFFVMTARDLGVPARLVTGFRIPTVERGTGIAPAGVHVVTNRDAWTWAEIPVAGLGWVVVDPTPARTTAAATSQRQHVRAKTQPPPPHQANAVPKPQSGGHAVANPVHHPKANGLGHHSLLVKAGLAAGSLVVLALALGPGLAAFRRVLRRSERRGLLRPLGRATDPAALTVGAWLDLLDGLHRFGMTAPDTATTAEVASSAGQHFGPDVVAPIETLGALADRALFCLTGPPDAPMAARAWTLSSEVQHEVAATLDRRQRARALLAVGATPRRPVDAKR